MLFNSNDFLAFFALFCCGYALAARSLTLRNILMVVASYVFYSWWDPRFCILLLFTSVLDYSVGRFIGRTHTQTARRAWLILSVTLNLGVLAVFKYFNFFRESLETLVSSFGGNLGWNGWDIVLPVGISFYTFQSMSYVIDVYRRQIPAERNLLAFLGYVSFFPHLVAGPIQRGTTLLPQFSRVLAITREDIELGRWRTIWGLFKKGVLADKRAPLVELVYRNEAPGGPMVLLGTIAFGFQIYCDFSGYSDIAIGISRLLGFRLTLNFNLPYFATDLRDFWRRWHISLSSWLRDYLYFPLGGSRRGPGRTYLNLGITMLLGGLWHGASLTFVLWGVWHGAGLIVHRLWQQASKGAILLPNWAAWLLTQAFVLYGWVLFRAGSLDQVLQFTGALSKPALPAWWRQYVVNLLALTAPLLVIQLWQWRSSDLEAPLRLPVWRRALLQGALLVCTAAFWQPEASPFIYFQF